MRMGEQSFHDERRNGVRTSIYLGVNCGSLFSWEMGYGAQRMSIPGNHPARICRKRSHRFHRLISHREPANFTLVLRPEGQCSSAPGFNPEKMPPSICPESGWLLSRRGLSDIEQKWAFFVFLDHQNSLPTL